jgi:hypothetical protein
MEHVRALEEEIAPLRRLAVVVGKFLEAVMKKGPKLEAELMGILQEIATLLGVKFRQKQAEKHSQGPTMN